jgi:putative Mn2+ efflux pump MntP
MLYFTVIAILFFLASQLFTVAVGIEFKQSGAKAILFVFSLAVGQAFLFWLGYSIGSLFMHLMESFKSFVVFTAFFLIGIRMLMESFQVWKGLRTYSLDSIRFSVFASLAQGINAFLVGLLFVFLPFEKNWLSLVLIAFAFLFSLAGAVVKSTKNSITFAALMFVLGGVVMIFSSIYIGFFAL